MRIALLGRLIFALALTIQVLSPVASSVARVRAAAPAVQICLKPALVFGTGDRQSPNRPERHGDNCIFCQLSCNGAAPIHVATHEIGVAPVQWRLSRWTVADRAAPTQEHERSHQPRAPPHSS